MASFLDLDWVSAALGTLSPRPQPFVAVFAGTGLPNCLDCLGGEPPQICFTGGAAL